MVIPTQAITNSATLHAIIATHVIKANMVYCSPVMEAYRKIGLLIERTRAYGRELCEGIITYAQCRPWEIQYLAPADFQHRRQNRFDGFIARVMTPEIAQLLANTKKPVVDVFCNYPAFRFALVKEKHAAIGKLAAEHFIDRRFSNFGFCPYGAGKTSAYCRSAYVLSLRRAGFNCHLFTSSSETAHKADAHEVIGDQIARPRDARALSTWIKRLPKPIGIFCPDDLRAWQVLGICRDNMIRVPEDVAVLGLDNDLLICGATHPMLSSIDPNTREIGRTAAETLDQLLLATEPPSRQIIRQIEPRGVVPRRSTETYPLDPPWLSDALVYISREATNGISACDVFAHLKKSHTLVTRAFARTLGLSVQKQIAKVRLEKACRLLTSTTLGLADIAQKSGFSSTTYFLQSFSAAFDISPTTYRTQAKA